MLSTSCEGGDAFSASEDACTTEGSRLLLAGGLPASGGRNYHTAFLCRRYNAHIASGETRGTAYPRYAKERRHSSIQHQVL